MRFLYLNRGSLAVSAPLRPQPLENNGSATIDGGDAQTNYFDSFDNGTASNTAPEVSFDFGRSV